MAQCLISSKLQGVDGRIVNTLHDEIVIEATDAIEDQVQTIVKESMEEAFKKIIQEVPFVAEIRVAEAWDDPRPRDVEYIRVALNPEQVAEFNLPHDPEAVNKKDTRYKKYIERFGNLAVELDALHPKTLQDMARGQTITGRSTILGFI